MIIIVIIGGISLGLFVGYFITKNISENNDLDM